MRFTLAQSGIVQGHQLADEVLSATGLDIRSRYRFVPPQTVEIGGSIRDAAGALVDEPDIVAHQAAIAAVVAAHVPNAEYSPQDRLRKRIRDAAQSAAGVKIDELTAIQQRALIVVLLFRAGHWMGKGGSGR